MLLRLIKEIKAKRDHDTYKRGFGYAMSQYYVENESAVSLVSQSEYFEETGIGTIFDKGVLDAARLILKLEKK